MWPDNSFELSGFRDSVAWPDWTIICARLAGTQAATQQVALFMYAFGAFQVDTRSHELRRSGVRVKIQDQPFLILVKLLERPGQLVTREELRSALWKDDTFVDFDTGLNTAVKRLRDV